MYQGSFASWTSLQFTLKSAAPLLLTALCTALPAQLGMVMIGGEGAVLMGGLAAALVGLQFEGSSPYVALIMMLLAGALVGGLWITLAGALRYYRGVNETISSLLLNYIAIALLNHCVEGPFKDPESLNKPSTRPLADEHMLGSIPGMDVHWGLAYGVLACIFCYVLIQHTTFGFAVRTAGGNVRAGRIVGLSVGALTLIVSFMAGAFAGIAGMVDVAAVNGQANSALIAGYGYAGILVSFIARHNPLAIIPVSILMGGILASGDLLQSRMHLPDAATRVLQGILFVVILTSESLYGRFAIFQAKEAPKGTVKPPPKITEAPALV
jgi:simple sugar transport system permease protein